MSLSQLPDILVIRHGETEWNRAGRLQGRVDSALTELGRAQAVAMGRVLADLGVTQDSHAILGSPQGRSMATAELALATLGLSVVADHRLAEVDIGTWSGLTMAEIAASGYAMLPEETYTDFCCRAPGGEGFDALWGRAGALLADLTRPTVLFTHGLTSRVVRTIALGYGPEQLEEVPGGQGVIFEISAGVHKTHAPDHLHNAP